MLNDFNASKVIRDRRTKGKQEVTAPILKELKPRCLSLHPEIMPEAKSIETITVSHTHAHEEIDLIEQQIGQTDKPVLMCCGIAATILAWRLSNKGMLAWDLGNLGRFK